ncbi:MAG TPA: hypothetical protein P5081_14055 [Phycisphaerae bacterium]|nr:hypothetical protein [Phycisphaerae bacterium]HRW53995.1 hypothetical protein [Phycisphaerae bacterium]
MGRIGFGQLRLTGRSEIVKEFRPRLELGPCDDPLELGPQVDGCIPIAGDQEFRPRLGQLESVLQQGAQLGKDRDFAGLAPDVMLGLGARDRDPGPIPIDVIPANRQCLGGASDAAVSRQAEQEPPFGVRAFVDDPLGVGSGDEILAGLVRPDRPDQMAEWVFADQLPTDRRAKELFGNPAASSAGVVRQLFRRFQVRPPRVGVGFRDRPQGLVLAEVINQVAARVSPDRARRVLHVGSLGEVGVQKFAERCDDRLGDQIDCRELVRHWGVELGDPSGGFIGDCVSRDRRRDQILDTQLDRLGGATRDLAEPDRLALSGAIVELDQAASVFEFRDTGHVSILR